MKENQMVLDAQLEAQLEAPTKKANPNPNPRCSIGGSYKEGVAFRIRIERSFEIDIEV